MSDRVLMYQGVIFDRAQETVGVTVFTRTGWLSPCGQFVTLQVKRNDYSGNHERLEWPVGDQWHRTPEAALAALAPKIRRLGERLIRQADELEAGGRVAS